MRDACNHIGPNRCPLAVGQTTAYNFVFSVNPSFPPIIVQVQVNLVNQDNAVVSCFVVDIAVRFKCYFIDGFMDVWLMKSL